MVCSKGDPLEAEDTLWSFKIDQFEKRLLQKQQKLQLLCQNSVVTYGVGKEPVTEARLKSIEMIKYFVPTVFWFDFIDRHFKLKDNDFVNKKANDFVIKDSLKEYQQLRPRKNSDYEDPCTEQKDDGHEAIHGTHVKSGFKKDWKSEAQGSKGSYYRPNPPENSKTEKKDEKKYAPTSKLGRSNNNASLNTFFNPK